MDTVSHRAIPDLSRSLVGRVLCNHRLITELGSGGMGHVFYAEHLVIGRRAAIKVLKPEVSRDETVVARFLNEARAVNEIRHPNVIEITDIGREDDLHYIVMNFLEGETLGERIERDKIIDEDTVLRMARQVVSALSAAHERGIIHRDLKPDNIFITNHPDFPDYVKLLDFGIAKLIGLPEVGANLALTAAGTVLGTPWYMSPEQCRGIPDVDARSDMYSLAVVLYQALTGEVPFPSPQPMDVMIAQVTQPPVPPIEKNRKLSAHVNAALMKALEKDPLRRFTSLKEFWLALSNTREEPVVHAPHPMVGSGSHSIAPAGAPQSAEDRGAQNVASTLTDIIKARLANDRLVLPAMPAIAVECLRVIKDPRQTFKTVGAVIAKDPLLSSRILKMANSAAFPGLSPATNIEAAIGRMGIDGLSMILVQFSLHQAFTSKDERIRASFRGIWEHSLAVALLAKDLASKLALNGPDSGTAYLAGLLHDVGKPVVASMLGEAEKQISKGAKGGWVSEAVWRKIVSNCHRPVGVLLAKKWNLPREIACTLEACNSYDRSNARSAANVVCLANNLAKRAGLYVGDVDHDEVERLIATAPLVLGLSADVIDGTCSDIFARVATMLDGGTGKNSRPGR
jgi:putative nucleotidyltransferase with HDIG domain